ncbi:hypothetical protein ONS95_000194 [Cadophora gregata]|uniref:uncharacterized protein n=1 Tax=Cadophora gregata TaxID=51156 RepID=UPI0026DC8384|nr:uncharacterized protein ONS95_000194 [Cadophora gregata]KAK0115527.1 hypothetical protein ONS96_013981 [Cadophora gregata f. sp. sojae]KAK0128217.1 hypothetical protein ONS95_000194 [Cadophora gregata]
MSLQYTTPKSVPTTPLYASCITNIKQKARSWGISSQNFDLDFALINSQIRVHGAYGAYSELEKIWHVEFYIWSKYFGNEPFPFPFPSIATPTIISTSNPAPAPTGPRAMNSTPVPNPFPPVYIPGPLQTPNINTGGFRIHPAPVPGSGTRAQLSHQHQGSSPASGSRSQFSIRGMAGKGVSGGPSQYRHMGQAYNNRPTRGRGIIEREPRQNPNSEPAGGGARGVENGDGGGGGQRGRGAVYAARRQLKVARRTQGRN